MEHTPKNIMIRAVRRAQSGESAGRPDRERQKKEKADALMAFLGVQPTLELLLREL